MNAVFCAGLYSVGLTVTDPVFWAFVALWVVRCHQKLHQGAWTAMLLLHQMTDRERGVIAQHIDQYLQEHPDQRERE